MAEINVNQEWEVNSIINHRIRKIKNPITSRYEEIKEYLVKWENYVKPSWEPEENLEHCQQLLNEYKREKEEKQNDQKNKKETKKKIIDYLSENENYSSSNKKKKQANLRKSHRPVNNGGNLSPNIKSKNIINNINFNKEKNNDKTINLNDLNSSSKETLESLNKTNYNSEEGRNELDELKILDVIGVIFPKNNSEAIKYKIIIQYKDKEETKIITKDNNEDNIIIPDNLLVKLYENIFGAYYKGRYVGK